MDRCGRTNGQNHLLRRDDTSYKTSYRLFSALIYLQQMKQQQTQAQPPLTQLTFRLVEKPPREDEPEPPQQGVAPETTTTSFGPAVTQQPIFFCCRLSLLWLICFLFLFFCFNLVTILSEDDRVLVTAWIYAPLSVISVRSQWNSFKNKQFQNRSRHKTLK